jgi:hypothetical protein
VSEINHTVRVVQLFYYLSKLVSPINSNPRKLSFRVTTLSLRKLQSYYQKILLAV